MVIGHLALPTILKQCKGLRPLPLYAGSVCPDAVDKGLQQAGLAVNGRTWAHTLLSLILTTMLVWVWRGRIEAVSWAVGYFGHLICDSGGFVPWLHPFATYKFYPSERSLWHKLRQVRLGLVESLLVIWSVWLLVQQQIGRK
ncbi:MAG: hypothetical protein GY796_10390 [Chloroflexi bacterium]|nr:hypothetical protein [Chloroflexota bacterium]